MSTTFAPWRTISVFISSTFSDMEAERDVMKKKVIPNLEEYFRKRRVSLKVIDLRWGVNTHDNSINADEREAQILKVCFDEIKRSRPFFIALLGDRYGWIPSEKQYHNILNKLSAADHELIKDCEGVSVTAMEILFGAIGNKEQLPRSLFYFRNADYAQLTKKQKQQFIDKEPQLQAKVKALHRKITDTCTQNDFADNVRHYQVSQWDGTQFTDLQAFGKQMEEHLKREIEEELHDTANLVPKNWYEQEQANLDAFIQHHTENFIGREKLIADLLTLIEEKKKKVLTGFSGCGKSSVMCQLYILLIESRKANRIVLFHSAGISSESVHIEKMLQRWSRQLCEELGIDYQEIEPETGSDNRLEAAQKEEKLSFAEQVKMQFLQCATQAQKQGKELIVLIDALDRFMANTLTQNLGFLPQQCAVLITSLPLKVKNTFEDILIMAFHNFSSLIFIISKDIEVEDMEQFSADDAQAMIQRVCSDNHKDLHRKVLDALMQKQENGIGAYVSPLWLNLATTVLFTLDGDDFREIRARKETDNEDQIQNYLLDLVTGFPADAGELFLVLLKRAAEDYSDILTYSSFYLISASRHGLREKDLAALLGKDWDELRFASLRRWFRVFLVEQGDENQWYLAHNKLVEVLNRRWGEDLKTLHGNIARYLLQLPDDDLLKTTETMYHLMQADEKQAAAYYYANVQGAALQQATETLTNALMEDDDDNSATDWIASLCQQEVDNKYYLFNRYVFDLNELAGVGGYHQQRLRLLQQIVIPLEQFCTANFDENKRYVLSILYSKLGDLYQTLGDLDTAKSYFEKYNQLCEELYASNRGNESLKNGLAISYERLGDLYKTIGDLETAKSYFEKYNQLCEELYESNPQNINLIDGLANSYYKMCKINIDLHFNDEAHRYALQAQNIWQQLYDATKLSDFKNKLDIINEVLNNFS